MNGDATTEGTTRAARKPRPEIQIYRPGMLRNAGSTKNISTNEERPPRPEKLTTSSVSVSGSSRRRSNDTDSVTSRGGSGSTTPDANAMNERVGGGGGRNRFERSGGGYSGGGGGSSYNSTQSLYDTRQQGGYMEYNGGRNRGGGRNHQQSHYNHHQHPQQQHHRQPFERPGNYSRGFNERASMRGDGAIARRPQGSSRRQRNDSINSTQSEMPQSNNPLHIDTSFDSASQCGASSNFSMNSLGEALSFEEMCQNMQNFASMDWSKEVENEFALQMEQEEREEEERRKQKEQEVESESRPTSRIKKNRNNRRNNRRDESDRESSFGGSIAEEEEEAEDEVRSGERTPTSVRSEALNPRLLYQRTRGNDENSYSGGRRHPREKKEKEVVRRYRGEHDDRDDDDSEYNVEQHMTTGRLAGRITIVPRNQNQDNEKEKNGNRTRPQSKADEITKTIQKRRAGKPTSKSAGGRSVDDVGIREMRVRWLRTLRLQSPQTPQPHFTYTDIADLDIQNSSEMANREQINRRRQADIDKNEGPKLREISEKIEKLSSAVKKRDLQAAEKMAKFSLELAELYQTVILPDVVFSFMTGLEQKLFRHAFYKSIESLRSGSNSASPDARLIRAITQKLLLTGILFYENLISTYQTEFHVDLQKALTWTSGFPSDEELMDENGVEVPVGIQKFESATQKTALKSLSRHLISLGDLHRYKSLIDGSENYDTSKSYYLKSSQLWPSTGHPYNQLGIVVYYSMLYRSARRARLVPIEVLSRQRQKRVIDEFFYLVRALSCSHPYESARDRLKHRLDAMRSKVAKYQPTLDKECGILKAQSKVLRNLQRIRQIWIHPISKTPQDGTGERIVDDVLSNFIEQPKTRLHRRAVSYLCDTFGMLVTKIGMDHFESVSDRAFGLLYASLTKKETDFSTDQLIKLSAMFIYSVHANSSDSCQLSTSISTVLTFYSILLQRLLNSPNHRQLLLPALNVIATWISGSEFQQILIEKMGGALLRTLPSTIISADEDFDRIFEKLKENNFEENQGLHFREKTFPEFVLLASFFKTFDPNPPAATSSRISKILESLRFLSEKMEPKNSEKIGEGSEEAEPKSREQIIDAERGKGNVCIVIHPEYLVPDTNVFIGELELVKEILNLEPKFQILIPTRVLDELISLSKSTPDQKSTDHDPERYAKAKIAITWLREQSKLKNGQLFTLTTTGKRLSSLIIAAEETTDGELTNDDQILNSALHWSDSLPTPSQNSLIQQIATSSATSSESAVLRTCILITGDRGLTIKAIGNNVPCRGIENFVEWIKN